VVAGTFFALAAYVGYEAAIGLWFRHRPEFNLLGLVLAVLSLVVMPVLGVAKRRLAQALNSQAPAAEAWKPSFAHICRQRYSLAWR
jgi:divalent metal cation (Fe/Co/Zn/Cd) transporter